MKQIALHSGEVALVDDEDFDILKNHKWYVKKGPRTKYAQRHITCNEYSMTISMHATIMGSAHDQLVDHADGNGLNNQRSNLRFCTKRENARNKVKKFGGTSEYKGVHKVDCKKGKSWGAIVTDGSTRINLGTFYTQEAAALAYNQKSVEVFGEFAKPNEINVPIDVIGEKEATAHQKFLKSQSSPFRGVYSLRPYADGRKRYAASVQINGKRTLVGVFEDQVEAALAYNVAALKHLGAKAKLNVIDNDPEAGLHNSAPAE